MELPGDQGGLQFGEVETEAAGSCEFCRLGLGDEYYEVNGKRICTPCRTKEEWITGGSRIARVLKASALGFAACIAAAAIWWTIVQVTGFEIGLVAIGVGFLVGNAVRIGSENRGGWLYQLLAIGFTYVAMVAYYVPYVLDGLDEAGARMESELTESPEDVVPAMVAGLGDEAPPVAEIEEDSVAVLAQDLEIHAADVAVAFVLILGIAMAAPFLAGAENLMGLLILAFALFEAWRHNRRGQIAVLGPFSTSGRAPEEAAELG